MKHCDLDLPTCDDGDAAKEFTTTVECLENTPGFFPVHSGRLPKVSQLTPPRVVIFGTDWGKQSKAEKCRTAWKSHRECRCQRFRREEGPKPYPTEGNLFEVLTDACVDPEKVFLTNAVLGLAKNKSEGNARMFGRYPKYLRRCGEYHRRCLRNVEKPALAVLMGEPHLAVYGCSIWSVVWPELFGPGGQWAGTAELKDAFESDRTVATTTDGWCVQLMYHPSKLHIPQPPLHWQRRTVEDLRQSSKTVGAQRTGAASDPACGR